MAISLIAYCSCSTGDKSLMHSYCLSAFKYSAALSNASSSMYPTECSGLRLTDTMSVLLPFFLSVLKKSFAFEVSVAVIVSGRWGTYSSGTRQCREPS